MAISATIPAALMKAANAHLEALGHGPDNFSVSLRSGTGGATHAGLHCWDIPAFKVALSAMVSSGGFPGLKLREASGVEFTQLAQTDALEWTSQENWHANPIMKGGTREAGGKTWVSLMDYNVWAPGVSGWREVVSEGYPAWIQPTGAHDAYALGAKVAFNGKNYESVIPANVWSPAVYPAGWKAI